MLIFPEISENIKFLEIYNLSCGIAVTSTVLVRWYREKKYRSSTVTR